MLDRLPEFFLARTNNIRKNTARINKTPAAAATAARGINSVEEESEATELGLGVPVVGGEG
jgi:hypothetical protein